MHPREVDQLQPDEYAAMVTYALREQREEKRAIKRAQARR